MRGHDPGARLQVLSRTSATVLIIIMVATFGEERPQNGSKNEQTAPRKRAWSRGRDRAGARRWLAGPLSNRGLATIDRTARIPSGVASSSQAAKGCVFCQLKRWRQLKNGVDLGAEGEIVFGHADLVQLLFRIGGWRAPLLPSISPPPAARVRDERLRLGRARHRT